MIVDTGSTPEVKEQLEAMRAVKSRLDPKGILGRGTLWG
jgi:FAD/FMN-containing dehydrogenase